jgi:hypothetical protein
MLVGISARDENGSEAFDDDRILTETRLDLHIKLCFEHEL